MFEVLYNMCRFSNQIKDINIQLTLRYHVIYEYYKIICSDLHMHLHVEVEPQNDIPLI